MSEAFDIAATHSATAEFKSTPVANYCVLVYVFVGRVNISYLSLQPTITATMYADNV